MKLREKLWAESVERHRLQMLGDGWTVGARVKFNAAAVEFYNDPEMKRKFANGRHWPEVNADLVGSIANDEFDMNCIYVDFGRGSVERFSKDWLELV